MLLREALLFTLLFHALELLTLLGKSIDLLLLFYLLEALSFLDLHELLVGLREVSTHLGDLLLTLDLALLLSLKIFLGLTLDKFTFEHLLLKLLDVIQLEAFELLADVSSVLLLKLVLLLELSAHLFIVLAHLLALDLDKVLLDVLSDLLFTLSHLLLGFLLIGDVTHEHLTLEGLNHVLLVVHGLGGSYDLHTAELILVFLLFSVKSPTLNLITKESIQMLAVIKMKMLKS